MSLLEGQTSTEKLTTTTSPNPFGGLPAHEGDDAGYVVVTAFIVFTMQTGFTLFEAGTYYGTKITSVRLSHLMI